MFKTVEDVNWDTWSADITATLMFVFRDNEVLLIRKKRGLGKGKINGPGGKLEPGESLLECAIRETKEEVCITPHTISPAGELFFQFVDGLSIHCSVFRSEGYSGQPSETEEANPFWCSLDELPFDEMWEDDVTWFDLLIKKTYFTGNYIFDQERMLDAIVCIDKNAQTNCKNMIRT